MVRYKVMGKSNIRKKWRVWDVSPTRKEAIKVKKRKERIYKKVAPRLKYKFKVVKA